MASYNGANISDWAIVLLGGGIIATAAYFLFNNPLTKAADKAIEGASTLASDAYSAVKSAIGGASNAASQFSQDVTGIGENIQTAASNFSNALSNFLTGTTSGTQSATLYPQNLAANNNLSVFAKAADKTLYLTPYLPASALQNQSSGVLNLQTGQVMPRGSGISPVGNPGSVYGSNSGVLNLQTGKVTPIQNKVAGPILSSISDINKDLKNYTVKRL